MPHKFESPKIEIDLPICGGKAVVKEWITGREQEAIEAPVQKSMLMTPTQDGKSVDFGNIQADKINESTHIAIKTIVMEVKDKEGNKIEGDDIVELILDLPVKDYNAVLDHIQKLVKKNSDT